MRRIWITAAAALLATTAQAADRPVTGPVPAWVKPLPLPAAVPADDAPVKLLLQDEQVSFEPGRENLYLETAFRIQTAQGLADAGNISIPWDPAKDVLTVHKLQVRRGDKVIDLLASGPGFTIVRRETNLEKDILDGMLTATMQAEGLQVGDVVDFAVTISTSDPVLKGHVETIGGEWNAAPVAHAHLRLQWPASMAVRVRGSAALPPLKPVRSGATMSAELDLSDVAPFKAPTGAPARYGFGREVEASDFDSWAGVASLMAPLYEKAATVAPQGALRSELERIRAASADPKTRAEAALALVQDRVRYVLLAMGNGGLVPADAETTWARRFGDCKAKTALLLSLLHGLGIEAVPVLVHSTQGDGLDQRLPMVGLFDHVLVRATIAGRTYWLDGTRTGDRRLDAIAIPDFAWALPVLPSGATLTRLVPPPLDRPAEDVAIRIDARAGLSLPAPARVETVLRGDDAVAMRLTLAAQDAGTRERTLKAFWKDRFDFIDPDKADARFDDAAGEEHLVLEGQARMDWSGERYEADGSGIGGDADLTRDAGEDQAAPFAVRYPMYERTVETILLPPGAGRFRIGDQTEVNETVGGIDYRRHATLAGDVFTLERSQRSLVPELSAPAAAQAQTALNALAGRHAFLMKPRDYVATDQELAAMMAADPKDAAGFVARADLLAGRGRADEAIADYTKALALDSDNVWALAGRGLARAIKGDDAAAGQDLDAAGAADPANGMVLRARGLLAERRGTWDDAIAFYTHSLRTEPGNGFALMHRAEAYRGRGDLPRAIADADAAIRQQPDSPDLHVLRAGLLKSAGRDAEALAEAQAVVAADPASPLAYVAAARIDGSYGRQADAVHALDRALALKPDASLYLTRMRARPKEDVAGRRSDLEAALRLAPRSPEALEAKARFAQDNGDARGAIAAWSEAIAAAPADPRLRVARGIAYSRAGESRLAEKDFAAARGEAKAASLLNSLCWEKAIAGVALQSALEECDLALRKAPDSPAALDSRGLVLLRLGRVDEAIAAYDRALAERPDQPSSLFGRAAAWARKGDLSRAAADSAAALKADPDVRAQFEGYGIRI